MPEQYDTFFNPNICHVCKLTDTSDLTTCDQCYMVSYCSKGHREMHHSSHVEICAAVQKLLKKKSQCNTCPLNLREWIQSRKEFLSLIESELSRDLRSHEVQMIMYAKSCLICHRQTNLYTCTTCYSANYCSDHTEAFMSHCNTTCKELLLCLSLDMELFHGLGSTMKFNRFPHESRPVVDMDTFVKRFVQRTHTSREVDDWHVPEYFYSDYASGPLTLYYGVQDAKLIDSLDIPDTCYVHVIDASYIDRQYVPSWEILLHLLNEVKALKVILIGPELHNECNVIDLCSKCNRFYSQRLSFESYNMLYHDYTSSESYKRPNVIIGFNVNFNDGKTWSERETILKLRDQDCPLVLTAKSKLKAEQNINRIQEIFGTHLSPLYHDRNKFASRRPWRDIETINYVYFRNIHVTVYRNLHNVT